MEEQNSLRRFVDAAQTAEDPSAKFGPKLRVACFARVDEESIVAKGMG